MMLKKIFSLLTALFLVFPSLLLAQSAILRNPLAFNNITDLLIAILNVVLIVAMPIIVLYLIYAGFLYVTAQGKPEKIQEATRALLYGVIGGVVIVGAFAILAIVRSLVAEF